LAILLFSGSKFITTKLFIIVNDPTAETGDEEPSNQVLSEETQARLREIFSWLQKDARDQIRDVDHFEVMLEPINQELPEISKLPWSLSQVWISIT
jgi:hypothetical protein